MWERKKRGIPFREEAGCIFLGNKRILSEDSRVGAEVKIPHSTLQGGLALPVRSCWACASLLPVEKVQDRGGGSSSYPEEMLEGRGRLQGQAPL